MSWEGNKGVKKNQYMRETWQGFLGSQLLCAFMIFWYGLPSLFVHFMVKILYCIVLMNMMSIMEHHGSGPFLWPFHSVGCPPASNGPCATLTASQLKTQPAAIRSLSTTLLMCLGFGAKDIVHVYIYILVHTKTLPTKMIWIQDINPKLYWCICRFLMPIYT